MDARSALKVPRDLQSFSRPDVGPSIEGLDMDNIVTYVKPNTDQKHDWESVPDDIEEQPLSDLGIPEAERSYLAGVGAQYDSELVYHNMQDTASKMGIVYSGIEEALHDPQWEPLIHEKFMTLIPPTDHKFAALHGAVWSGGSFVYVPKGTKLDFPLQSYFRLNAKGAGQFEHTLIIVEDDADLHFIEGCSAPKYNVANLHAGAVELFVGKRAHLRYSTIENWSKNMYNLNTKRARVDEDGDIEWISGSFGSHVGYLYPMSVLNGRRARSSFTGITFAVDSHLHAFSHTCRNLYRYDFFTIYNTFAAAGRTFVLDDFTFAATLGTYGLSLHHAEDTLLGAGYASRTVTGRTGFYASVAFSSCSVAVTALHVFLEFEFLFYTGRDFLQVQFYLYPQVGAAELALTGLATAASKASESAVASEDVAEHGEDIVHRHALSSESSKSAGSGCSVHSGMSELIVTGTLVRIAQHFISFGCFLEFFFRFFIPRILVRMILYCFFCVCFFYNIKGGCFVHLQNFVIVSFCHVVL